MIIFIPSSEIIRTLPYARWYSAWFTLLQNHVACSIMACFSSVHCIKSIRTFHTVCYLKFVCNVLYRNLNWCSQFGYFNKRIFGLSIWHHTNIWLSNRCWNICWRRYDMSGRMYWHMGWRYRWKLCQLCLYMAKHAIRSRTISGMPYYYHKLFS